MIRHWTRQELEQIFSENGSRADRAAAVRHLLTGCEWCSAVARRAARGSAEVSYDLVIDRVIARLARQTGRSSPVLPG